MLLFRTLILRHSKLLCGNKWGAMRFSVRGFGHALFNLRILHKTICKFREIYKAFFAQRKNKRKGEKVDIQIRLY